MKTKTIISQIFISALVCAVIVHFVTPKYVRDTVNDMECEKEDRQIIQRLAPTVELAGLSHDDLHQKREEVVKHYYQQIKDKEEQEQQGDILKEVLGEMQIMSEEEIAKEAERIRQQENK